MFLFGGCLLLANACLGLFVLGSPRVLAFKAHVFHLAVSFPVYVQLGAGKLPTPLQPDVCCTTFRFSLAHHAPQKRGNVNSPGGARELEF